MSIYPRALLFELFDTIEIFKHNFNVGFVLEEHLVFHCLRDRVHPVETHLLIVLVYPEFIEMFDEYLPILDIVCDILPRVFTIISKRQLIGQAHPLEALQKLIKLNIPKRQCPIIGQTLQILIILADAHPHIRIW